MPTATKTVPDIVLDVLNRSTTDGNRLDLPEQLTPADYREIKKVIIALGGKWDRRLAVHLWPDGTDVAAVIEPVLLTGTVTDQRKLFDAFYTPPAVAEQVIDLAGIELGHAVLEPSAGDGALAIPAAQAGGVVDAYELRDVDWSTRGVTYLGHSHVLNCGLHNGIICGSSVTLHTVIDFLTVTPAPDYHRVIMNPPFSNQQDMRHVLHAARFVAPGGRLVAVMSPSFMFRTTKIAAEFRDWLWAHTHDVVELPDNSFKASGTGVRTVLVTVDL